MAARKLKLEKVPVIVVDHLTEPEKRAYSIADNKITLNAGWDEELLCVELEALKGDGFELETLGFSEQEFSDLLDSLSEGTKEDQDSAPDTPEVAVTRSGDLWHLGEHLLLCADATAPEGYLTLLSGKPADMVFTDPPYNVSYRRSGIGRWYRERQSRKGL